MLGPFVLPLGQLEATKPKCGADIAYIMQPMPVRICSAFFF
jgi:hypothetical protein